MQSLLSFFLSLTLFILWPFACRISSVTKFTLLFFCDIMGYERHLLEINENLLFELSNVTNLMRFE